MQLISRNETSLVVGLIASAVILFQRPLRFVWDVAADVQSRYQVDLMPALTILVSVSFFHEYRSRQQMKAAAAVAAAETSHERTRSDQLERLRAFSQALANALDRSALQQVLWQYMPAFVGSHPFWILAHQSDRWETYVLETAQGNPAARDLDSLAERALSSELRVEARFQGVIIDDAMCFPMIASGQPVGVLGVDGAAGLTVSERQALGAAAAFVAFAVRNVQLFIEMHDTSVRDGLTGCLNRGTGLEMLEREILLASRQRQPLSILMFDIDRFKSVNDRLGHLRGDDLLRAVGAQMTRVLRRTDLKCRYGGDEFLVILADTPLLGAQHVAEGLRREIEALTMVAGDRSIAVTASFGIATASPGELGVTALIQRADDALYEAKRAGRNRASASVMPDRAAAVIQ